MVLKHSFFFIFFLLFLTTFCIIANDMNCNVSSQFFALQEVFRSLGSVTMELQSYQLESDHEKDAVRRIFDDISSFTGSGGEIEFFVKVISSSCVGLEKSGGRVMPALYKLL